MYSKHCIFIETKLVYQRASGKCFVMFFSLSSAWRGIPTALWERVNTDLVSVATVSGA